MTVNLHVLRSLPNKLVLLVLTTTHYLQQFEIRGGGRWTDKNYLFPCKPLCLIQDSSMHARVTKFKHKKIPKLQLQP